MTPRGVIVTGGARGLGRAIAERLRHDGRPVALIDVDDSVRSTARELDAVAVVADLADHAQATRAVDEAVSALDGCWGLVNNAGIFHRAPLLETSVHAWDRVQVTNVRSMLSTIQAVAPAMIDAGGGRIINQASMAAKKGTPGEAAYAASKAAVVALTRIAAMELGPHGITVNSVCPGYVLTELGAATRSDAQVAEWTAMSPLGRLGEPDDVAAAIAHLLSDDAAYVTGQAINVTGGMCTW